MLFRSGGDVVGKVGHDAPWSLAELVGVDFERVGLNNRETIGPGVLDLPQRRQAAAVALDRDHLSCAGGQNGARKAAWPWADLDDRAGGEIAGRASDTRSQIQIEEEMLAQGTLGAETVLRHDLAKRRQTVRRRGGQWCGSAADVDNRDPPQVAQVTPRRQIHSDTRTNIFGNNFCVTNCCIPRSAHISKTRCETIIAGN